MATTSATGLALKVQLTLFAGEQIVKFKNFFYQYISSIYQVFALNSPT